MRAVLATAALAGFLFAQEFGIEGLPDFSRAGFREGAAPPRQEPTLDLRDFGALGDGREDVSAALQRAIDQAGSTRGVVRIPRGLWRLERPVHVERDGVVIQGAGATQTILFCPNSLADIHGPSREWSWSGGMIALRPARAGACDLGRVTAAAPAGARRLRVAWNEQPQPGDWLQLAWFNDTGRDTLLDHLYGGVVPHRKMGRELQEATGQRVVEWIQTEECGTNAVTLAGPLPLAVRTEWKPTLRRRPALRECGIEGVAFEFPETPYPGHLKEKGYNAIHISSAIDCWVRDVTTRNADSGVFVNTSKRVTVSDVVLRGRTMHHCLSASWSSDCLFTRWRIEAPHVHGTTISWAAHGNVFSHGWGRALAMDSHRAASFRNLHSAVVIEHGDRVWNPFRSGGSAPRGPHAARENVYWNIEHHYAGPERPVTIGGHAEWPLAIFVAWRANRELRFEPVRGMGQRVLLLNRAPPVADLHAHQRARRVATKRQR